MSKLWDRWEPIFRIIDFLGRRDWDPEHDHLPSVVVVILGSVSEQKAGHSRIASSSVKTDAGWS